MQAADDADGATAITGRKKPEAASFIRTVGMPVRDFRKRLAAL
jgi:hypothetical protein